MEFSRGTTVSSAATPRRDSEDLSLVLRQILRRSSPPPPPPVGDDHRLPFISSVSTTQPLSCSPVFSCSDRLSVDRITDDSLNGVVLSSSPTLRYFPSYVGSGWTSGSGHLTGFDRDYVEEYENDCDNEEAVVEEAEMKNSRQRNQTKRSRAAEVHNLSEKRRRSRINEKMKALQNLIPNSNKTDKASMLDEAIEYLKQLQLQVQMLSIRNGLSLHAMCLPGAPDILHPAQLSRMGRDLGHQETFDIHMTNALNINPTTSDTILSLPKQCASATRPSLSSVSDIVNSKATSFGPESCVVPNFGPFDLYDQANFKDQTVHQDHHNVKNLETASQVTTGPHLFDIQESDVKGHNPLEEQRKRKCGPQVPEMLMGNVTIVNLLTSDISGLYAAATSAENAKLIRR